MVQAFDYSLKTIELRALNFVLVKNIIKLAYRLQISFNLDPGQLSNLPVKLMYNRPSF